MVRKTVFVSHATHCSGAESVLIELIGLAVETGEDVVLVCPSGDLARKMGPGVTVVRIPVLGLQGQRGPRRALAAARMLVAWLIAAAVIRWTIRRRSTVTIVNSLNALPAVALAFASTRRRFAWLVHDTVGNRRQRAYVRMARHWIATAVAVSSRTAAPLEALDVPTVTMNNGTRIPAEPLPLRRAEVPVVGMLALITPWKGQNVLLEAAAGIPGLRVELAGSVFPGDEPYERSLRERAAEPDLAGRVAFLGHADSAEALGRWDALVGCSVSSEAGPLAILEALAHGVPVVVSQSSSPNVTTDSAWVVPDGDVEALREALVEAVTDAGLREQRRAAGRELVQREFDLARTRVAMLDVLTRGRPR